MYIASYDGKESSMIHGRPAHGDYPSVCSTFLSQPGNGEEAGRPPAILRLPTSAHADLLPEFAPLIRSDSDATGSHIARGHVGARRRISCQIEHLVLAFVAKSWPCAFFLNDGGRLQAVWRGFFGAAQDERGHGADVRLIECRRVGRQGVV